MALGFFTRIESSGWRRPGTAAPRRQPPLCRGGCQDKTSGAGRGSSGRVANRRTGRSERSCGHGNLHSGRVARGVGWTTFSEPPADVIPGRDWGGRGIHKITLGKRLSYLSRMKLETGEPLQKAPALEPGAGPERIPAMSPIRMVDLRRQHRSLREPIEAAVREVLEDCDFVMGRAVAEFEAELEPLSGSPLCHGVRLGHRRPADCPDGPGDRPGTTRSSPRPFSFAATVEAIVLQGARPVFADIDPRTYNLDPGRIGERITSRTRAILPVHLFGHSRRHGAHPGARPGETTAGHRGRRPRPWEPAIGDNAPGPWAISAASASIPPSIWAPAATGGRLLTNDPDLARKCRMISLHGAERRYRHEVPGLNSRLDSLQAAILRVKLSSSGVLDREAHPDRRGLRPDSGPSAANPALPRSSGIRHVYNQYSIRSPRRDLLAEFLRTRGVECAIHYPLPLHLQPAYRQWSDGNGSCPHAEALAEEILSLPIFPELTREETDRVAGAVRDFWKS